MPGQAKQQLSQQQSHSNQGFRFPFSRGDLAFSIICICALAITAIWVWLNTVFPLLSAVVILIPATYIACFAFPAKRFRSQSVLLSLIRRLIPSIGSPSQTTGPARTKRDFFIYYHSIDRPWAEWVSWQLEVAGYSAILPQAWDDGQDPIAVLNPAQRDAQYTIVIASSDCLEEFNAHPGVARRFESMQNLLLPVCVDQCELKESLAAITPIDLVGLNEQAAKRVVLQEVGYRVTLKPSSHQATMTQGRRFPGARPRIWNVPEGMLSPLFSGRKTDLKHLWNAFKRGRTAALMDQMHPQAISGLSGSGKTQIALEYANRYHGHYEAVLWARACSQTDLELSSLLIVEFLDKLGERIEAPTSGAGALSILKRWLKNNPSSLLILDDFDASMLAESFPWEGKGRILLTTCTQAVGRHVQSVEIEGMDPSDGALLLLRRSHKIEPNDPLSIASLVVHDRITGIEAAKIIEVAKEISRELGGLPNALDFAGAYIEVTGCSLADFLALYRGQRAALLQWRSTLSLGPAEPIAATWKPQFDNLDRVKPAAADLLRFCTFLAADAIPEELLRTSLDPGTNLQTVVSDLLKWNNVIADLLEYSLVKRTEVHTADGSRIPALHIQPLLQAVLQNMMDGPMHRLWAQRAVQAVHRVFPQPVAFENWQVCEMYVAHAQACTKHIEQFDITSEEAIQLLYSAGCYLLECGRYAEAEPLLEQAKVLRDKTLGAGDPDLAKCLNKLGEAYHAQGKYAKGEPCFERARDIRKDVLKLGLDDPDMVTSVYNLGRLYHDCGKDNDEIDLYKKVVDDRNKRKQDKTQPFSEPTVFTYLDNLGWIYLRRGYFQELEGNSSEAKQSFSEAERLYLKAKDMCNTSAHPDTARSLANLGYFYTEMQKYGKAQEFTTRAVLMSKQVLGEKHPLVAFRYVSRAVCFQKQGKKEFAKSDYKSALEIYEQKLGSQHPAVVRVKRDYKAMLNTKYR